MNTKEKILALLVNNSTETISGQYLAQQCGISRTAVWKSINTLRSQGYDIEGTTNGGYKLINNDSILSKELFLSFLKKNYPEFSDSHIDCFSKIDSTNTYAKKLLSAGDNIRDNLGNMSDFGKKIHRAIIISEEQTHGRGRLGRTFFSPAKKGIYLTIIFAPEKGITQPAKTTAYTATGIIRALKKLYDIDAQIKWINDIFINRKKVAGILTEGFTNFETNSIECAIIGIGINTNISKGEIPETIKKIATSISTEYPSIKINHNELAATIVGEVLRILDNDSPETMKLYKEKSFILGSTITVHPVIGNTESQYKAKAIDIDDNAGLIVQLSDGTIKTLISGEVSLKSGEV